MVSLLTHICVTRPQWVNKLRPKQNGCHFADDIFKYNSWQDRFLYWCKYLWVRFVPQGSTDIIKAALVKVMTLCWTGYNSLSEPMMAQFTETQASVYRCHHYHLSPTSSCSTPPLKNKLTTERCIELGVNVLEWWLVGERVCCDDIGPILVTATYALPVVRMAPGTPQHRQVST